MASLDGDHSLPMKENGVEGRLMIALMVMTVVTGFVDAVSYLGLGHVFTANMTGNIVLLGFAVAGAPRLSIARSFTSLGAFLVGAVVGGRVGVAMISAPRKRWLLAAGISEAAMLFAAAVAATGFDAGSETPVLRLYAIIILTALPMGLRTATVRRLAVPDITTTVLTTTLAAVAADSSLAGGSNPRMGRRIGSVVAMLAGASIGALFVRFGLAVPLLVGGTCVLTATIIYSTGSTMMESEHPAETTSQ
ncbi:MAG TPA: YoaK family protein [Terriglobales bacterium]|nr:YoaK family protein [Terriglobales bacterium]